MALVLIEHSPLNTLVLAFVLDRVTRYNTVLQTELVMILRWILLGCIVLTPVFFFPSPFGLGSSNGRRFGLPSLRGRISDPTGYP